MKNSFVSGAAGGFSNVYISLYTSHMTLSRYVSLLAQSRIGQNSCLGPVEQCRFKPHEYHSEESLSGIMNGSRCRSVDTDSAAKSAPSDTSESSPLASRTIHLELPAGTEHRRVQLLALSQGGLEFSRQIIDDCKNNSNSNKREHHQNRYNQTCRNSGTERQLPRLQLPSAQIQGRTQQL
ncbi:hypothetical protein NQ317_000389 [Molorchus minor]|uniref:Uncharacterized protein n=1 Tax=Molorchus minor TaxID=1323400 RepID=A0ABQ9JAQ3_9CUCU|nr:hypothetical protein NQ317_000389 [Molorchus minor]